MEFSNRADQLKWVYTRFIQYVGDILEISTGKRPPILDVIQTAPMVLVIGKASDMLERWGDSLEKEEMTAVMKVIMEFSGSTGPEAVAQDAVAFVQYLETNAAHKAQFFRYLRALRTILA